MRPFYEPTRYELKEAGFTESNGLLQKIIIGIDNTVATMKAMRTKRGTYELTADFIPETIQIEEPNLFNLRDTIRYIRYQLDKFGESRQSDENHDEWGLVDL